jgi:hypothetical protein
MFRYRRKRGIKLPREIARWLRGFGFILLGVVLLVVAREIAKKWESVKKDIHSYI